MEAKLQTYRKFKILKMDEDENVAAFFLCVNGIVNTIIGLGDFSKNLKLST